jgi:hypothetical protein
MSIDNDKSYSDGNGDYDKWYVLDDDDDEDFSKHK